MRALWIATSLCLASTVVLAQSTNKTVVGLDTCFKLVRVTEENCSTSTNDTAQRQQCLQNARKVQLACLELAGPQAFASVDRPPTAAGPVSSDKPAEAASQVISTGVIPSVNPVAGTSADQSESQSAKTSGAVPSDKSVAAISVGTATTSTSAPSGTQGSGWTVSETTSPVDYSPLVTATIPARSETKNAPTALVVRCRGRRTELGLRMEGSTRASRGGEIPVAYQINDQPMVKLRWAASADGKTASYREDATALLQSFSEDARLKIIVVDGAGRDGEAAFQLAGWNVIRDKIATACMWTSTASKSSERR
ncbi:hypothetical protein [Bradyrhizobium sp. McL0615]|uniref:hypothetical protein n=1 Tax=Bradyrhizobium sp. McL0615 TaxID=3415673 RepID=UPI003CF36F96